MNDIRFGRSLQDLPQQLEFGDWGVLQTAAALELFQDALAHFDQEDVIAEEKARRAVIEAARKYYDGNHIKPLTVRPGEPDDNVLVNLCRSLIDDSVSWLFGNPETGVLRFETQDGESEEVGTILEEVYEASGGFNFFKRLGTRGSVSGHAFIKISPQDDGTPKLTVLDPMLVSVRTDPADTDRVIAYKIEWRRQETDPRSRRRETYIYRQMVVEVNEAEGAWVVGDFKCKDRAKRQWFMVEAWAWPWRWSPIVDAPNIQAGWGYYGISDLEDAAGINDALNFLSSNTMRILKLHAHPKTIGTGMAVEELQETAVDSFWVVPNPEAKINNLEMQSDLQSSLQFLEFLKTAFWTIGRGMDPAIYKDKIGQVTNFALRVLAIRSLHKAGDKRLTYGKLLRTANEHILEMTGSQIVDTAIQWPEPLPEDPNEEMVRLEKEVALEITSRETAAQEIGRSWDVERKRIEAEKKERATLGGFLMEQFDRGEPAAQFGDQNQKKDQQQDNNNDDEQPAPNR